MIGLFKNGLFIGTLLMLTHVSDSHGRVVKGRKIIEKRALPLTKVLENFESFKDKTIVAEAKIEQVCKKKGCWVSLRAGDELVRVSFANYGFFVPKDLNGQWAKVKGKITRKKMSVKEQRHYLEDAGADEKTLNNVSEAKYAYAFTASGIEIEPRKM